MVWWKNNNLVFFLSVNLDQSETTREAQREMYSALQQRKEALEETMRKKLEELKQLCLKEGVSSRYEKV